MATVHKSLNLTSTPYINNMFSLTAHDTNGGRVTQSQINGDVHISRCRLEMTKANIRHRGAIYFNEVPNDARGIETTKGFVNKLRRMAKTREYY